MKKPEKDKDAASSGALKASKQSVWIVKDESSSLQEIFCR